MNTSLSKRGYSVLKEELSAQEISLGMSEASSVSNVRIINNASNAYRVSPRRLVFFYSIFIAALAYLFFLTRHLIGDRISNYDSLVDFVGKDKIIGEFGKNEDRPRYFATRKDY